MPWVPYRSWRMPNGGGPDAPRPSSSTSAMIQLVVASSPWNSIPADFRTALRPPSHPTT
jgi:hypothetical protein